MATYYNVNVPKPGNNAGRGINARDRIILFDMEDVTTFPQRDGKGVVITDNIVFKQNAYMVSIYVTSDKTEVTSNTEGETDNEGFIPSIKFSHPGNSLDIREFKHNWLSRNCGIIVVRCDGSMDLLGSPCTPMKYQVAYTGNKDANSNEITFTQAVKGDDIAIYKGTLTFAEPVAVVAAGAASISLSAPGEYQLTGDATAATITGATGASAGMVFTLLGVKSGTPPIIESSTTFVLADGADWTANPGTQITFRAYKADTMMFIEQSRK